MTRTVRKKLVGQRRPNEVLPDECMIRLRPSSIMLLEVVDHLSLSSLLDAVLILSIHTSRLRTTPLGDQSQRLHPVKMVVGHPLKRVRSNRLPPMVMRIN